MSLYLHSFKILYYAGGCLHLKALSLTQPMDSPRMAWDGVPIGWDPDPGGLKVA